MLTPGSLLLRGGKVQQKVQAGTAFIAERYRGVKVCNAVNPPAAEKW
jgi:hypothetical protein